MKALEDFKMNNIQVLICTDIVARGIDISGLPYVVNYDMPYVPEDYIHRIGRTGRAGEKGTAISFVGIEEKKILIGIEKLTKQKIKIENYSPDEPILPQKITKPIKNQKNRLDKPIMVTKTPKVKGNKKLRTTKNLKNTK